MTDVSAVVHLGATRFKPSRLRAARGREFGEAALWLPHKSPPLTPAPSPNGSAVGGGGAKAAATTTGAARFEPSPLRAAWGRGLSEGALRLSHKGGLLASARSPNGSAAGETA